MPPLSAGQAEQLGQVEAALVGKPWIPEVNFEQALKDWRRLATQAVAYPWTVDDYTNDLSSRDYLEAVLFGCKLGLRDLLSRAVLTIDDDFRQATLKDLAGDLAHYYRVDASSGWWRRRVPCTGPLAEYLAET
jgi:hypothetical protein